MKLVVIRCFFVFAVVATLLHLEAVQAAAKIPEPAAALSKVTFLKKRLQGMYMTGLLE
ncbi:1845_t:CDS:2 [Paraglomus brasilianum]|uniref:1845_t:CDS:1 n=1 Tax=Paraglomus brasilianum TaxID=144538 RepID=A0A9N9A2W1_9GLOM|nr:1845_t:CDS:2 [Paraglomus brasilianum]